MKALKVKDKGLMGPLSSTASLAWDPIVGLAPSEKVRVLVGLRLLLANVASPPSLGSLSFD